MDFEHSDKVKDLISQVSEFMDRYIYPAEEVAEQQVLDSGDKHHHPEILEGLRQHALDRLFDVTRAVLGRDADEDAATSLAIIHGGAGTPNVRR